MEMASALDDLNVERRAIEEEMKADAIVLMDELDEDLLEGDLPEVICLYKDNWHQGVIGILAARIREKYNRPTIIFAPADESEEENASREIKGSARSISTIHIRDVFDSVASQNENLLEKIWWSCDGCRPNVKIKSAQRISNCNLSGSKTTSQ